jgi:hypothetical protein
VRIHKRKRGEGLRKTINATQSQTTVPIASSGRKIPPSYTHVMKPRDLVFLGVRLDVALKIHVVAFFDVFGIQSAAQVKDHLGRI